MWSEQGICSFFFLNNLSKLVSNHATESVCWDSCTLKFTDAVGNRSLLLPEVAMGLKTGGAEHACQPKQALLGFLSIPSHVDFLGT